MKHVIRDYDYDHQLESSHHELSTNLKFLGENISLSSNEKNNNNSNYINEFQEIKEGKSEHSEDNGATTVDNKQTIRIIGLQGLPDNPELHKFSEQALYKFRQKELTKQNISKKQKQNQYGNNWDCGSV